MTTTITVTSGRNADNHVCYASEPLDALPLSACVDGIDVEVSASLAEPTALRATLTYPDDAHWEEYSTGVDVFGPVKLGDLPVEFHGILTLGAEENANDGDSELNSE